MSVNPVAAKGFQDAAGAYVRGRPSYPPEAIDWLAQTVALGPGATVVDVGAGTGKLTEVLLRPGATVIAVEPVAAMRAELSRTLPAVTALAGTADALPLGEGSADTIAIGQAYHWFAGQPALAEFARVLRADGRLALLWNARDRAQPLWREVSRVIEPLRDGTPQHGDGRWRQSLAETPDFRALAAERFPYRQMVDRDGLLDRVSSISFIAALEPARRAAVLDDLAAVAAQESEPLALDYVTEVYVFERVSR